MAYFRLFLIKILRSLLKPLSFLPAVFMMCLIFGFSAQNAESSGQVSDQVTVRLVETYGSLFNRGWDDQQIARYTLLLEHGVRKAAHMTEYFLLAVTLALPLYIYRLRGWRLALSTGLFCIVFACLDEYHQSFVPGRSPSPRDVCIDTAGSLAGIYVTRFLCYLGQKIRTGHPMGRFYAFFNTRHS